MPNGVSGNAVAIVQAGEFAAQHGRPGNDGNFGGTGFSLRFGRDPESGSSHGILVPAEPPALRRHRASADLAQVALGNAQGTSSTLVL